MSSCKIDKKYLNEMIKLNKMFDGISIYICSDLLSFFVNSILPKIEKKFVLVSGDSDLCVPLEALTKQQTHILLNSQFLIKWFIQNTRFNTHEKIVQLPIGLDYHTIYNNPRHFWKLKSEGSLPKKQEMILLEIRKKMKPLYQRIPKIYVNFTLSNDRFGDREKSLKLIPNDLLIKKNNRLPRTYNWKNITNYAFVLSPFGVGMDCHRTWEALCLGSVPIVCAPNFRKLFEDLPVLIVNNWSDINETLLNETIETYKTKTFNFDKLQLKYWRTLINNSTK
jgi:hypothetical protein